MENVGHSLSLHAVTADDLGVSGALAVLLKDAIKPNLVQTLGMSLGHMIEIAHCDGASAHKNRRLELECVTL